MLKHTQGAAYNDAAYLESDNPAKVIKLAFENGVNAIDTSPVSPLGNQVWREISQVATCLTYFS